MEVALQRQKVKLRRKKIKSASTKCFFSRSSHFNFITDHVFFRLLSFSAISAPAFLPLEYFFARFRNQKEPKNVDQFCCNTYLKTHWIFEKIIRLSFNSHYLRYFQSGKWENLLFSKLFQNSIPGTEIRIYSKYFRFWYIKLGYNKL